jgi:hypothetical protein
MMHFRSIPRSPHDAAEPARDARLGAILGEILGAPPVAEVNWSALAARIGAEVRAHRPAPWWSYAERWQRRALPLALAAGLLGTIALWRTATTTTTPEPTRTLASADPVSALATGTSAADAASTFARSVTSNVDLSDEVPE